MALAVTAVLFDLLLPAVVLTVLAGVSLAVRREGPSTLGFHRLSRPGRQLAQVAALALGWTTLVFLLVMPVTEHLTGSTQDTSEFADLEGDLPRLLLSSRSAGPSPPWWRSSPSAATCSPGSPT